MILINRFVLLNDKQSLQSKWFSRVQVLQVLFRVVSAIHSAAMNCVATATLLYYSVACHCLLAFATATFSASPFTSIFQNDVAQSAKDVPHNTSGHRWLSKWRWKWTQDTPVTAYGKQFDENEEESIDEAKITTVGYIFYKIVIVIILWWVYCDE